MVLNYLLGGVTLRIIRIIPTFISTLEAPPWRAPSHTHENDVGKGDRSQNRPHGHIDPGSKKSRHGKLT